MKRMTSNLLRLSGLTASLLLAHQALAADASAPTYTAQPTAALCPNAAKADASGGVGELWAATVTAPRGPLALRSRAVDRGGNIEALKAPVRVQSVTTPGDKSYTLFLPYVARHAPPLGAPRSR